MRHADRHLPAWFVLARHRERRSSAPHWNQSFSTLFLDNNSPWRKWHSIAHQLQGSSSVVMHDSLMLLSLPCFACTVTSK
jgi:GH15 family glucan-1,4-alpha-glucosidase